MPNITGTGGADDVDVTNDNGTLNGAPQGTPIDQIRARGGNDTVTVTDSTISGTVEGNGGDDSITVSGSSLGDDITGSAGDDTIEISNTTISGDIRSGRDNDSVSTSFSDLTNINLGSGNDTIDVLRTTVSGEINGASGSDHLNLPDGTIVTDATFGTFTVSTGASYSLNQGSFQLPSGIVVSYRRFENGTGIPCLTRDTLVATDHGPMAIQDLHVGTKIPTAHNGPQTIRWIGSRKFNLDDLRANPNLRPVRITAGALGQGLPERDLLVSRQHRMLVSSKIAERMFGTAEILIAAIKLTALPYIYVDEEVEEVEYFHLLFDQHEVIYSEGAPTESLYTGPGALQSISDHARTEIFSLFPELLDRDYAPVPATPLLKDKEQKELVARHLKNAKPLLPCALAAKPHNRFGSEVSSFC